MISTQIDSSHLDGGFNNDYSPIGEIKNKTTATKAWLRFFAKQLDGSVSGTLFVLIVNILYPHCFFQLMISLGYPYNLWFLGMIILFSNLLVEPFLLSTIGTTLGRWAFSIKLKKINGLKLDILSAFKRGLRLCYFGFGLGIPFS